MYACIWPSPRFCLMELEYFFDFPFLFGENPPILGSNSNNRSRKYLYIVFDLFS